MRDLWLLPDYAQSGSIQVLEGDGVKPLYEILNVALLPASFVLGIPEEVLLSNPEDDFVFAQYARNVEGKNIFSCSIRAGKDISGRTVFLTNLQILNVDEKPKVTPEINCSATKEIKVVMERLNYTLSKEVSASVSNVRLLAGAIGSSKSLMTFASEPLVKTANKPDWSPSKKKYSKLKIKAWLVFIVMVLLVLYFMH